MPNDIFCPNRHLIFEATHCSQCGWERPLPQEIGQRVWGPAHLKGGLGGPGSGVFAVPAIAAGIVAIPQRNGELIGLDLPNGELRWQTTLDAGRMIRELVADSTRFLAAISDERPLGQAGNGRLVAIDAQNGEIQTLWQADSHQVSAPAVTEEQILLRTSKGGLFALSRSAQPEQLWQQSLDAWWALTPFVDGDSVIVSDGRPMHGEGYLIALSISRGQRLWKIPTEGMLAQLPAACGTVLVFLEERKRLVAVDIQSGKRIWEQDYRRIYCPPQADDRAVYLIVRGDESTPEGGRYQLRALHPQDGSVLWQTALPARARILSMGQNVIYAATDDGRVLAYAPDQGKFLWEVVLSSDEDPIRTELLLDAGTLIVGTYEGKVFATRVAATPVSPEDEDQAVAQALQGDYLQAGKGFTQRQEYEKAFTLFEYGKHYQSAGELARDLGLNSEAERYFELAGNQLAQAEMLEEMGDLLGAAPLYAQAKKLNKAASLFEQVEEFRKALDLHLQIGNFKDIVRLAGKVVFTPGDFDTIKGQGSPQEVADLALKVGAYAKAAKLYEEIGDAEKEFHSLSLLLNDTPVEWAWNRMTELARRMGKFIQEAQAWEALKRPFEAANAYHRAAQQAERISPDDENKVAGLYEKAKYHYDNLGMDEECQDCQAKIIYFRALPQIIIEGKTQGAFREGEFNLLQLEVGNIGRGVAHNVRVQVGSGRFEIGETATSLLLKNIYARRKRNVEIPLRPMQGQIGDAVPLIIEWMWNDDQGEVYTDRTMEYFVVKAKDSSSTGSTPQHIHYHGTVYQGENVEVVGGDKVGGDQIHGDQLEAGSQKGDRVEIHRGAGVKLTADGLSPQPADERTCPTCYLPVEPDKKFCEACGTKLKADS
ncbi:MAG: PQQ-binding-like beta-propeller repeat protein [Anaerolineales bacterium]|nr:PQQ-binding-like beta-propeller repeat protein [Anaerolineales bacterium]